jgi:ribonucleoside-diphosphate reductase alpha chain
LARNFVSKAIIDKSWRHIMENYFVDQFSQDIFDTKYKGNTGNVHGFYQGLAHMVALGSRSLEQKFFDLMWNKRFSPGGRILAYAGRKDAKMSLMNCTTHKISEDSLEAISDAAYTIMRTSSRGQGIGIDLSNLRPRGAPVDNAARTSTGAISFMEMLNTVGGTIGQEGRRAAMLFSLSVDHPDLYIPGSRDAVCPKCAGKGCQYCEMTGYLAYDFLHVKKIPGKVENANISVRVSDEFMNAVEKDLTWTLFYEGKTGVTEFATQHVVSARGLFGALSRSAYYSAEPGILYWDTSRKMSNSDLFGDRWGITGVNACSEEVLEQDGLCNLGSMNLAAYVENPFTSEAAFNFVQFERDIYTAIEFLDNVITIEIDNANFANVGQLESLINLRRTGLGVMGTADMLAMMGLAYGGSTETINMLRKVFSVLRDTAYQASIWLAKNKGPAYAWIHAEDYHQEIISDGFFATLPDGIQTDILNYGIRNITLLSLAPTGTISNLLGVSSGIEPLFAHEFVRRVRMSGQDELINYVHPGVQMSRWMGISDRLWPTAYEVSPEEHVLVQAVVQQYIDASIAKTVNLPKSASIEDVENVYKLGWKLGLKGMSVYVDGSRTDQVLYTTEKDEEKCPSCGGEINHHDGCVDCPTCGWGKCSL